MVVSGIRRFRAGYAPEIYVAYDIPANEDRDLVPCGAEGLSDSSWRFTVRIGYCWGDRTFAQQHIKAVLSDHPTWSAGLYRLDNGSRLVGPITAGVDHAHL